MPSKKKKHPPPKKEEPVSTMKDVITKEDLEKFGTDLKLYLCALQESVYDRVIQRMNDHSGKEPKHTHKEPPDCSNPGCSELALESDGSIAGYPDGTYYLYCSECTANIMAYRNETDPVEYDSD